jgi:hypothetical protein
MDIQIINKNLDVKKEYLKVNEKKKNHQHVMKITFNNEANEAIDVNQIIVMERFHQMQ